MGKHTKAKSEQKRPASSFGRLEYWNDAFEGGEFAQPFDWLASWEDLQTELEAAIPNKAGRILIPGCGNAPFQLDMHDAGYRNLVCGDGSEVVIKKMQEATRESHPGIQWDVMDASDMPYPDDSFDAVVDKSLMDALLCSDDATKTTRLYFDEVFRVLAPGGVLVLVSCHRERSLRANLRGRDCLISSVREIGLGRRQQPDDDDDEEGSPATTTVEPPVQSGMGAVGPTQASSGQRGCSGLELEGQRPPEACKGSVVTLCTCFKGQGGTADAEAGEPDLATVASSSRKKTRDERRKAAKLQRRMVQAHMEEAELA